MHRAFCAKPFAVSAASLGRLMRLQPLWNRLYDRVGRDHAFLQHALLHMVVGGRKPHARSDLYLPHHASCGQKTSHECSEMIKSADKIALFYMQRLDFSSRPLLHS